MSWLRRLWRWLLDAIFGPNIKVPNKVKVRKQ
jgi:hypothetical protein